MLGLRFCVRAFSSCGERGTLFIAVRGPLTIAASLVAEHRLQTRRLSSCGLRAQLLLGMRDLPRPGLEPVYPALAGRFSTTEPPGKPRSRAFWWNAWVTVWGKKYTRWVWFISSDQKVRKLSKTTWGLVKRIQEVVKGFLFAKEGTIWA